RVSVDEQIGASGQVVHNHQLVHLQQHDVGGVLPGVRRFGGMGQPRLDVANRVVAEVAGQATGKPGHAGAQRNVEALLVGFDEVQRVTFVRLDNTAHVHHFRLVSGGANYGFGGQANKGIAPEAFAAHDGFQQTAIAPAFGSAMGQLQVNRKWGVQVRIGLGDDGNAVVALC